MTGQYNIKSMNDSKQTLKECLGVWRDAVQEYNKGNNQEALNIFRQVEDPSARVLYNIACAHIRVHQHDEALEVGVAYCLKEKRLILKTANKQIGFQPF